MVWGVAMNNYKYEGPKKVYSRVQKINESSKRLNKKVREIMNQSYEMKKWNEIIEVLLINFNN